MEDLDGPYIVEIKKEEDDEEENVHHGDTSTLLGKKIEPAPQYVTLKGVTKQNRRKAKILTSNELYYLCRRFIWITSVFNVTFWWLFYILSIAVTTDVYSFAKLMRLEVIICFALLILQYLNYYNSYVSKDITTPESAHYVIPVITILSITAFYMAAIPIRIDHEYNVWVELSMPTFNVFGLIFFQMWLYCLQVNTSTIVWSMYTWKKYLVSSWFISLYLVAIILAEAVLDTFIPPYPIIIVTSERKYSGYAIFLYVIAICFFLSFITITIIHFYYKLVELIKKSIFSTTVEEANNIYELDEFTDSDSDNSVFKFDTEENSPN